MGRRWAGLLAGLPVLLPGVVAVELQVSFFEYPDPFVWWHIALFLLIGFLAAFAIGAVGLGGVIVLPTLLLLPGMTPAVALGTVMTSFFPASLIKTVVWARAKKIPWQSSLPLMVGALPASYGGAALVKHVPKEALAILIACVCLFSSIDSFRKLRAQTLAAKAARDKAQQRLDKDDGDTKPNGTDATASMASGVDAANVGDQRTAEGAADIQPRILLIPQIQDTIDSTADIGQPSSAMADGWADSPVAAVIASGATGFVDRRAVGDILVMAY